MAKLYERRLIWRHRMGQGFEWLCRLATLSALCVLVVLLASVLTMAFSAGRGRGLAPVSLESNDSSKQVVYHISKSNIYGGRFEFKDAPGKRITQFTTADLTAGPRDVLPRCEPVISNL